MGAGDQEGGCAGAVVCGGVLVAMFPGIALWLPSTMLDVKQREAGAPSPELRDSPIQRTGWTGAQV